MNTRPTQQSSARRSTSADAFCVTVKANPMHSWLFQQLAENRTASKGAS
jgi:hypothetical protein